MLADAGAPLFGRRTYEDFHSFWPNQKDNPFTAVLDDMRLERSAKRKFAVLLFLLCSRALEAAAQVPSPEDVVAFSADSHSTRQARQLGRPDVTRDDLSIILTTYELIPREDWHDSYHHVAFGDRTGTFTLRDGTVVAWLVRPGALARLTLPDGTELHLALASGLSPSDIRRLATGYRDEWLSKTRPEDGRWLAESVIVSLERLQTGWHVVFETKTGNSPTTPEGLHIYYLHVYLDTSGKLERVVRGPDVVS